MPGVRGKRAKRPEPETTASPGASASLRKGGGLSGSSLSGASTSTRPSHGGGGPAMDVHLQDDLVATPGDGDVSSSSRRQYSTPFSASSSSCKPLSSSSPPPEKYRRFRSLKGGGERGGRERVGHAREGHGELTLPTLPTSGLPDLSLASLEPFEGEGEARNISRPPGSLRPQGTMMHASVKVRRGTRDVA